MGQHAPPAGNGLPGVPESQLGLAWEVPNPGGSRCVVCNRHVAYYDTHVTAFMAWDKTAPAKHRRQAHRMHPGCFFTQADALQLAQLHNATCDLCCKDIEGMAAITKPYGTFHGRCLTEVLRSSHISYRYEHLTGVWNGR